MSDDGELEREEEVGENEEGDGEKEPVDVVLSQELVGENLSLLCKIGNGLSHAYVRLELKNKSLSDVSILNCYVHVRYLDLSGNRLKDISAVNALPHLLSLKADHNLLTSALLEELQFLQVANFSHNQIASTDGIAHPMLEKLNLSFNKISVLKGLNRQHLPCLRTLDLHSNELTSTEGIELPTLQQLYLASNKLTTLEGLDCLPQLTNLHLRQNQISVLDGFSESLESLQYLNLRGNAVEELSEIEKLKCLPVLRALVLTDCQVSEVDDYRVETLMRLRKLERLDKETFTEDERSDAEELYVKRQPSTDNEAE